MLFSPMDIHWVCSSYTSWFSYWYCKAYMGKLHRKHLSMMMGNKFQIWWYCGWIDHSSTEVLWRGSVSQGFLEAADLDGELTAPIKT